MDTNDPLLGKTAYLARRAREGDRDAFHALYERLAPALYTWLRLRTAARASSADVQDLLQEVWLRAVRGAKSFDTARDFRGWMFGIAKNVLLQSYERVARDPVRTVTQDSSFAERDASDAVTSIGSCLAKDEAIQRFLAYVRALPPQDYQIALYCGLEGYTAREAALRIGIGPDAAAKRWLAVRSRLREVGALKALAMECGE